MTDRDGREARNSLPATALRSRVGRLVAGALASALVACSQPGGQTPGGQTPGGRTPDEPSTSATEACMIAFAEASAASDPEGTLAALEAAVGACRTAEDWAAAAEEHASDLEGIDPQQFLVDRCLEGPPDLDDTTLCQSLEVDR